jgi:hypothetical protein
LIRPRLIAPAVGATAVLCAAVLAGALFASNAASPAAWADGTPAKAILSSHVLQKNVLVGHEIAVRGSLAPTLGGEVVRLQQRRAGGWTDLAHSRSDPNGHFVIYAWPRRIGAFAVRVVVSGMPAGLDAASASAKVNVYHKVIASWYGPGGRTACGEELTPATLGVANKTLPCGTFVTLRYGHRTLRVRVIDRGPFVPGRDYDLTYATKLALGFVGVAPVWATR